MHGLPVTFCLTSSTFTLILETSEYRVRVTAWFLIKLVSTVEYIVLDQMHLLLSEMLTESLVFFHRIQVAHILPDVLFLLWYAHRSLPKGMQSE